MNELQTLKDEVADLQLAMKRMVDRMDNLDRRTMGSILIGSPLPPVPNTQQSPEKWPNIPDISMFKWVNGAPK